MVDDRLVGAWQSDRRRTFLYFKPRAKSSPGTFRKFKALFGKLIVRWDHEVCHTELDGHRSTIKYRIVARDAVSVVISSRSEFLGETRLQQIYFDGDKYWVALPGGICEFFRRLPKG
jgi:hypothetical protein